jgi:DNA-binding XRE family transcriptional regulator
MLQSQLESAPGLGGLFGVALTEVPTPMERLRLELRAVLIRKRGTQSRLAEALGLSRQTFANALSGRERFTTTAAAALRRWLDGEPISGNWPVLPPVTEKPDAA